MEQQQIVQAAEIPTPTTPTQSGEIKLEQRILRDVQKSLGGTVPPSISQPNCQTQAKPNKSPREPTDMNVKSEEKVNLSDSCSEGEGGTSGNRPFVSIPKNQQSGPSLAKNQKVNKISKLKNFWENPGAELDSSTKSFCIGPMGVVQSRLVLHQPTTEKKVSK